MKSKQSCKILKNNILQIAGQNNIEFITSECAFQGECAGTCPKYEAEVRHVERELEKLQGMSTAAVVAGMAIGITASALVLSSCINPLTGDIPEPESDSFCCYMPNSNVYSFQWEETQSKGILSD
jgi:hypothetical protein